jgi:hypothetical protein
MENEKTPLTPDEIIKDLKKWGGNSDFKEDDPNLSPEEKIKNSLGKWGGKNTRK